MSKSPHSFAWAGILALLATLLLPGAGAALEATFQGGGDLDTLVVSFAREGAKYGVRRVDRQQIALTTEDDALNEAIVVEGGGLVQSVEPLESGLLVTLKTDGFGYIASPTPDGAVRLQIFRDATGTRWQPREGAPPVQLRPVLPEGEAPVAAGQPEQLDGPPGVTTTEIPDETPVTQGNATAEERPAGQENSLFSVPYSVRVHVNGSGNQEIKLQPGEIVEYDEDTGSVLVKATNKEPFMIGQKRKAAPTPEEIAEAEQFAEENVTDLPADEPVVDEPLVPLDDAAPDAGTGEDDISVPAEPVDQRFFARIMRSVTGTPEPVMDTAEDMAMDDTAMVDDGQVADEMVVSETADEAGTLADATAGMEIDSQVAEDLANLDPVEDEAVQNALDDIAAGRSERTDEEVVTDDLDPMEQERYAGLTEEEVKRLEGLELQLLKAQSLVASGQLNEAKADFETILKDPLLPQDLRLEAQYSLGSVLMTLYKDNPSEKFNEITRIFTEAMNSDLKSQNVPISLMNLGLINLWVGNLPEAKAYFDILTTEYPYDEAVPTIGFHYGEYYYRNGEYEKAADLFQRFIETYPEQERLARRAAFLLADSLSRLGMFEQAFQIVDYIDKRWPQAYEENPGFLKLAGDIEYRLNKPQKAKGHYWTYYNMNPKAEAADVVLARLGDIYLEAGEQRAAKELYNRTVEDFPDMEGGLIAKMRLAEEGIYDEPTFMEMVTVFDKPYSLKPKEVYTEIVDEHPDSPLAPLALLKLGMWHFFQQEYAEALTAAQRMFTDYPRSPLAERAKELGDKSFALAVPRLLEEENHQLIVDYWERYDFANMSDGDEANATRIGVAKSYSELAQYDEALDLLEPFLGETPVDTYSELALAVGLDTYIQQHAWNRIQELARKVEQNWDLSDRARRLLLHAEAIALENLGESEKAVRLWAQLGADEDVEPFIRADAMYHLAKEAMNHQDLRRVFVYAQEALAQLLAINGDEKKIKDCLLMSIYATERSGRYQQALEWAQEYDKYVPEDDPEWAATRYRLARIYRKAGAEKEWREILEGIRDKEPNSLYGRLSATAIETNILEERAQEYAPIPN